MKALLASSFPDQKPVTYLNHYKGPYNDRKLGTVSFVEFADHDSAKGFVEAFGTSQLQVQAGDKKLLVKKARTQKNSSRNWALRKAEELLKAVPGVGTVKLEWKYRKVTVGGVDAYTQGRDNLGNFVGEHTTLKLP